MVLGVRLLVGALHVRVPLLAEILGGRVLGGSARHQLLRVVLGPEVGHGGDGRGPNILAQCPTRLNDVGLFPLELFDRTTSRRQIHAELVVEDALIRDRLGDVEQQRRGSSELQLKLLVRLVSRERGHGCYCSR